MKRFKLGETVIENLIGVAITIGVGFIATQIKSFTKKKPNNDTMVSDLTVGELREILKGEAEA